LEQKLKLCVVNAVKQPVVTVKHSSRFVCDNAFLHSFSAQLRRTRLWSHFVTLMCVICTFVCLLSFHISFV